MVDGLYESLCSIKQALKFTVTGDDTFHIVRGLRVVVPGRQPRGADAQNYGTVVEGPHQDGTRLPDHGHHDRGTNVVAIAIAEPEYVAGAHLANVH